MKTVTIEVTQQDIDKAIAWRTTKNAPGLYSMNCPLARAGRRAFHNVCQAYGYFITVYKHNNKPNQKSRTYTLDSSGSMLMKNYDDRKFELVKPCTITLTRGAY